MTSIGNPKEVTRIRRPQPMEPMKMPEVTPVEVETREPVEVGR